MKKNILFIFMMLYLNIYCSNFISLQSNISDESEIYLNAGYKNLELVNIYNLKEENNVFEIFLYKDYVYEFEDESYLKFDIQSNYEFNSKNTEDNILDIESGIKYTYILNNNIIISDRLFFGNKNYPELNGIMYYQGGNQITVEYFDGSFEIGLDVYRNYFEDNKREDIKTELFLYKNLGRFNIEYYSMFFRTDNEIVKTGNGPFGRKFLLLYIDLPYEENEDLDLSEITVYYDIIRGEKSLLTVGGGYAHTDYKSELSDDEEEKNIFLSYDYYLENKYLSNVYIKNNYYFEEKVMKITIGMEKFF